MVEETNDAIKKTKILLGKEIDDPVDIDSLLCAIAEAKMLIGENGAREVLAEVERSIYKSNRFLPLKKIQYYKAKLFLARSDIRTDRKINRESIKQISKEGTSLAHLYGFKRHEDEIIRLGRRLVDIEETSLWLESELANSQRLINIQDFL